MHLPAPAEGMSPEVLELIEILHRTEQRLEELTAGEIDTVAHSDGRPFLLPRAQDHLRMTEAATQMAILNALPARIALLDAQACIVGVNASWRQFEADHAVPGLRQDIGADYLLACEDPRAYALVTTQPLAAGIRTVLDGSAQQFVTEYCCASNGRKQWFQMVAAPLVPNHPNGVVVMHLDITERMASQLRIAYLNRVYATLSGINTLIVRVRDTDTLFREACRVAVDAGGFRMALIVVVNAGTSTVSLAATAGVDTPFGATLAQEIAAQHDGQWGTPLLARAIGGKKMVVVNNLLDDQQVLFHQDYIQAGISSMAILPLLAGGEVVAALVLYASELAFFRDEELQLLAELADDIAFALDHVHQQEKINYLAYYDVLTGLANQRLYVERLAQHVRSAASAGHRVAVFLMDLERFKNINDSLGQPAGDQLLRETAQWLMRNAGDASLFARLGADRFAAILPIVRPDGDVVHFLERKVEAFQGQPFRLGDSVLRIGVKVGVALYPEDGVDANTLFMNAEAALKNAKVRGERYLLYTPKMTQAVAGKVVMENQLRLALERGEFVLHYQPKVSLASGLVTSAEALIRWNDPRTGLVPPAEFIPVLEETGLIHEVGRWALRQAVSDYLRWRNAGLTLVRIAVNVSPLQLRNRGFIAEVAKAVGADPQACQGLELEITESLIMEDVKHSIASLKAIRDMGITIAIDDFGTGFSSLSYLAKFPVDTLKIDRSFVLDMTASPEGLALVSTIINLAHALKLKVVAEGVDTQERSQLLRVLGCDEFQGYLFSKPVPSADFEQRFLR